MHLDFNAGLQQIAADRDMGYFDLVAKTARTGTTPPQLDDAFRPGDFDHHLVDRVAVRRMHYVAAGKVFDLRNRKGD